MLFKITFTVRLLIVILWTIVPNALLPPCFRILYPCPLLNDFAVPPIGTEYIAYLVSMTYSGQCTVSDTVT